MVYFSALINQIIAVCVARTVTEYFSFPWLDPNDLPEKACLVCREWNYFIKKVEISKSLKWCPKNGRGYAAQVSKHCEPEPEFYNLHLSTQYSNRIPSWKELKFGRTQHWNQLSIIFRVSFFLHLYQFYQVIFTKINHQSCLGTKVALLQGRFFKLP